MHSEVILLMRCYTCNGDRIVKRITPYTFLFIYLQYTDNVIIVIMYNIVMSSVEPLTWFSQWFKGTMWFVPSRKPLRKLT